MTWRRSRWCNVTVTSCVDKITFWLARVRVWTVMLLTWRDWRNRSIGGCILTSSQHSYIWFGLDIERRGDLLTSVLKEKHAALLTLRIMRGSIATQKKLTRIKLFFNFQCFYALDSSENLRCVSTFFWDAIAVTSLGIMGKKLGNIYFSTNQKLSNCLLLRAGGRTDIDQRHICLKIFFRSWYTGRCTLMLWSTHACIALVHFAALSA
jgi:hypothetical protein